MSQQSSCMSLEYEDVPIKESTTYSTCSTVTSIATVERGESSKGKKRSYDSTRYASLTPEQRQARQNRQRARRQSLTPEQRQELNARRRAHRKSLPPEKRQALLDQRKASYKSRQDTLCSESIAMQCPELGGSSAINRLSNTSATTAGNGARESFLKDAMDIDNIHKPVSSPTASPLLSTPTITNGNGALETVLGDVMGGCAILDNIHKPVSSPTASPLLSTPTTTNGNGALETVLGDVMGGCAIPSPVASLATNPPSTTSTFTIGTDDDLDNFLTDVMDEETISEEEMDEEYHIFAGEGCFECTP